MRTTMAVLIVASTMANPVQAQFMAKKFKIEASADTNAIVPKFFTNRDFVPLPALAAAGGELSWFAGRVIYRDGNGDWVFLPVVTKGKPTWNVKIPAVPFSFSSKINNEYKGDFNIPVVTISANMKNAYDYQILDIATINVPDENVPDQQAVKDAVAARALPPNVPVFWVASVTLTTVSVRTASEVKSGGAITGVGFSTGASTYNAASSASYTPLACLGTMPMNEAAIKLTLENKTPSPATTPVIVDKQFDPTTTAAVEFSKKFESKLTRGGGVVMGVKAATE